MPDKPENNMEEDLIRRYHERMEKQFSKDEDHYTTQPQQSPSEENASIESRQYKEFKAANLPGHLTIYEKLCNASERIIKISPGKKRALELSESISICHLNASPEGVYSFALLFPIIFMVVGSLLAYILLHSVVFVLFFLIIGIVLIMAFQNLPDFLADQWRMRASNQMVLCIFYIVTYMRHTSNLELAVNFAAEHLSAPLSVDLKKVIWGMETHQYSSVKEALDVYLESWRKWNLEFIETIHLIESSLYEPSEDRRLTTLDRALSLMLDETYEKMLHYAQNLKSPITMLHMLGIILPILGLVILPLIINFIPEIKWYHIAFVYDVALPVIVYYLARTMLSKRPTGYGDTDISEQVPEYKKYKNILIHIGGFEIRISPLTVALAVGIVLVAIGLLPPVIHLIAPDFDQPFISGMQFLDYRKSQSKDGADIIIGPYGLGASLLGLLVPLGIGLGIAIYFKTKSRNIIKIRNDSKMLEQEFASAIFQLGNRIGDGLPIEIACGKVAELMQGTVSGNFFGLVNTNITRLGMGITQAIFDPKVGALKYYPSSLIESTMKVLVQTAKKGVLVVSQALMNVSRYIKEIHQVNERLKDLLSDVISSMKAQIAFLTPVIAGIVVGITSMITTIIGYLNVSLTQTNAGSGDAGIGMPDLLNFFGEGIPTYYFQMIVGFYVIEITYILVILANGVENGADKLGEEYYLGESMATSIILYTILSAVVMIAFNVIASQIMKATIAPTF